MSKRNLEKVRSIDLAEVSYSIFKNANTGKFLIHRYAARGKVNNYIENYEFIDSSNRSKLLPLTLAKANEILDRIENNEPYSSIYIFYENPPDACEEVIREKSEQEHVYTSTGIKFWRHQEQMWSYKNGQGHTIISTHISPEGACNLKCPYCSVTYRDTHSRIDLDVIKDYVVKLQTRGLKAVILTGGGEPTAYKYFNELVQWLKYDRKLSVALITNGTLARRLEERTLAAFSWIRVSINLFNDWETRIGNNFDISKLNPDCIVGCSMVYTVEHESTDEIMTDRRLMFKKVSKIADKLNAKYIRLLPNCLLDQKHLIAQHASLAKMFLELDDKRFFHQYKLHKAPRSSICHQSYFRPYLSEEPFHETGIPGTVYPCDSVVLNDSYQYFAEEYQLCAPHNILDYLDKKVNARFDPRNRCKGCVFTENVNMLEDWKTDGKERFSEFDQTLKHEEFV